MIFYQLDFDLITLLLNLYDQDVSMYKNQGPISNSLKVTAGTIREVYKQTDLSSTNNDHWRI